MGWADLATSPLCDMDAIQAFADEVVEAGLDTILLIGQGGSTQAPMTITKYNKHDSNRVKFRTLDSDSPVRVREMLTICDPHRTLVIISSKSGGTIEPRMLLEAVRASFEKELGDHVVKHLVAITDPGSRFRSAGTRGRLACGVFRRAHGGRPVLCALGVRVGAGGAHRYRHGSVHGPRSRGRGGLFGGRHR